MAPADAESSVDFRRDSCLSMRLVPGQFVVHPHHGPAVVLSRTSRQVQGQEVTYLELDLQEAGLTISLPESKIAEVGIRDLSSHTQVRKLMSLLQKPGEDEEKQWSRRIKACQEKLNSGELRRVAEVARDLYRRGQVEGLSMAERTLHREAVSMLGAEIALVLDVSLEEAEDVMNQAIDGTPLTRLGLDRGKKSNRSAKTGQTPLAA